MKAAIASFGWDPETFDVVLYQLVNLLQGGEPVVMSKRSGKLVTLRDVVDEVGRDAARFFYIMRSADTTLDFDLDLAKSQSDENPVYYVQYAHARICSILRQAAEAGAIPAGLDFGSTLVSQLGLSERDLGALSEEVELDLVKMLANFPNEVALTAERLEPHRIARYAMDLASIFHSFYNACRVISADEQLTKLRLALVDAVRVVIANSLAILGVDAPQRM
jgi:arginyl-tRNA synthetase